MKTVYRRLLKAVLAISIFYIAPVGYMVAEHYASADGGRQSFARHDSTQQAPDANSNEAVIQVYAARAARWRGAFGVHTWMATKRSDERRYTRLEVNGYRVRWGGDAVRIRAGIPDSMWFGNHPTLLREIRGNSTVDELIDKLHNAAQSYPYNDHYKVWPGPNSNTFVAHLARQVPQLRLELPPTAIGKDFLPDGAIVATTPSGKGFQVSAGGYAGLLIGLEEGIEVNLLSLSAGVDLMPPAIKLPGIGRIGFDDTKRFVLNQTPEK